MTGTADSPDSSSEHSLDTDDSGVLCRYLDSSTLSEYANVRMVLGEKNMPCRDAQSGGALCDTGLTCSSVGANDSRCLAQCQSDDDCVAGVSSCQAAVCQVSAAF